MAISGGDGSIILTTKVDETGLKKGLVSMKKLGATAGKAFLAIGAAATTATVAITKMAVSAYADYEQLVGGVETLFKDSAQKVIDYANDAFYTAGVSANEYMQQVTSFSASLIRSTANDTDKAADIANMALIDISDNVNKMGSSMESVTLAYQGFAKQQYMLLDNLKLGYGGTKTEMERLLEDAQALTGVKYDINNLADVYSAIHAIQEELGITGTTAKEAEKTITGSANMMKAAWQNVLTAISGGGNLDRAIENLVYSVGKYFENIVPVIERSLYGIGRLIERIAPLLVQTVASALIQAIPSLIVAVYRMIIGLAQGIYQGIIALFLGSAAKISGVTDNFEQQSASISSSVDNQNELTDAVEETAKAQEKSLAGFDKINKLTEESASSAGGSGGGGSVGGGGGSTTLPSTDYDNSFVEQIDKDLAIIMSIAGVSLIAIGLIMLFLGNIAWGIGFIIAGAMTVGAVIASVKDTDIASDVIGILSQVMGAVGGALVAIGIILIMLGSTAIGVGLIVAGAVALIGSVAALVAFDVATVENVLKLITGIAGGAMLALGVMLCIFSGPSPVSIGLIVAGAVGLVSSVALNFEAVKEKVKSVFNSIMQWLKSYGLLVLGVLLSFTGVGVGLGVALIKKGVSNFTESQERKWEAMKERLSKTFSSIMTWLKTYGLLILGVVLCFTGIGVGLGIPLIKKGAKNLAESQPRKWEAMKERLSNTFNDIIKWIKTYGLLILGIVLCFSGVGVGLGIALIKKGVKNLAESKDSNWDTMYENIKEAWGKIKTYWDENIAQYFTASWWSGLATNIANGFIGGIEGMINGCINGFEKMINWIIGALNEISFDVPDWVPSIGGKKFGFNLETVDLKEIAIPRLAKGAVIPPNHEFLAVLGDQKNGTNIETPLKTMIEAFNVALDRRDNVGNGEQTIVVTLDGEVLFKNTIKKNKNYILATGVNPLGL